ncbi:MAG: hypothetical protein NVSMB68_13200 [Thermoanaerobaculia bacterium]
MKRLSTAIAIATLVTASAFAHAGHAHAPLMGTVTMLHGDNSFMIRTADGKDMTIVTTATTRYMHADDHMANRSELTAGTRVIVKMNRDGKTAASVKMSAGKKK